MLKGSLLEKAGCLLRVKKERINGFFYTAKKSENLRGVEEVESLDLLDKNQILL